MTCWPSTAQSVPRLRWPWQTEGSRGAPASLVAAITGVAGPKPDEDGNPVGLLYVAVVARDGRQRVEKLELGNQSKGDICHAAVQAALKIFEELLAAHVP